MLEIILGSLIVLIIGGFILGIPVMCVYYDLMQKAEENKTFILTEKEIGVIEGQMASTDVKVSLIEALINPEAPKFFIRNIQESPFISRVDDSLSKDDIKNWKMTPNLLIYKKERFFLEQELFVDFKTGIEYPKHLIHEFEFIKKEPVTVQRKIVKITKTHPTFKFLKDVSYESRKMEG